MSKYLLALLTASGLFAGCSDSPDPATEPPPPTETVERVEVAGPMELTPGASVRFVASAFDADDQLVTGRTFTWESDTPAVATVGADGTVTALTAGEATIYATTGDVTGGVFLTVTGDERPVVAYVELEPSGEIELAAGATLQLTATARAADGSELLGRELVFQTEDPAVATVSATGLLTAVASGRTGVRVICESQRDDLTVRVPDVIEPPVAVDHVTLDYTEVTVPVGETMLLVAQPRDAEGAPLDRPVTWSSNNPAYVSVSATGIVTAIEPGGADITATSEGKSVSVRVWASFTQSLTLTAVGGQGIPALLGTFTTTLNDSTMLSSVRLWDGYLAIDHTSGTYEIVLQGLISTVAQPSWVPLPITYESYGSVATDVSTGEMTFTPGNFGAAFTGRWVPTGMQVTWKPDARMAGASTLLFTE